MKLYADIFEAGKMYCRIYNAYLTFGHKYGGNRYEDY